jgi:hypothetical protein
VYFPRSPSSGLTIKGTSPRKEAATWIGNNYSAGWVLPIALSRGIGIHHGRVPRSVGQYIVSVFNEGQLRFLVCTSTLIEGVNTTAKNVIIFNKTLGRKNFDFFTFNNIAGRSGRMFEHFVGRVFLFHEPPHGELPFVDFPFITQGSAPDSLLVQIEGDDLTSESKKKMEEIQSQEELPLDIIKGNVTIDPNRQIELAKLIDGDIDSFHEQLSWTGFPTYEQLGASCTLIWNYLAGERPVRANITSANQLAYRIFQVHHQFAYPKLIEDEMSGDFAADTIDQAVDRVLDFERTWATFHFPRMLMALSNIQEHVFQSSGLRPGNYLFFANQVESLFRNPVFVNLDEFGLPLPLLDNIESAFPDDIELDEAVDIIKAIELADFQLDDFENDLIERCQSGLS